jgi:hypothetical protein
MDGKSLARAFNNWEESSEGLRLLAGSAEGQYLRNRLRAAFKAGVAAAERHAVAIAADDAAQRVADYFETRLES